MPASRIMPELELEELLLLDELLLEPPLELPLELDPWPELLALVPELEPELLVEPLLLVDVLPELPLLLGAMGSITPPESLHAASKARLVTVERKMKVARLLMVISYLGARRVRVTIV
jgi:hypothetical protein